MSAPPNGVPNGQNPPPPGAQPLRRKKNAGGPLVPRKKPIARPPPITKPNNPGKAHAFKPGQPQTTTTKPHLIGIQAEKVDGKTLEAWKTRRRDNQGWWDPPPAEGTNFKEYPVVITKQALQEGLRSHVMRVIKSRTAGATDPTNQDDFPRPVTLHRKDPAQIRAARETKDATPAPVTVDEAEAERLAKIKLEKEAQRAIDQAQIAPVSKDAAAKRQTQKPEKSTTQTYYPKRTDEQKKQASLRYEESLPWVLEDADGKHTYVGAYIAALSEMHATIAFQPDGKVHLTPMEKWYQFAQEPNFKTFSTEEAEKMMNLPTAANLWDKRNSEKNMLKQEMNATRQALSGRPKVKMESYTFKAAARSEKQDHDELDVSGDEFQDDDENQTFDKEEHDEDAKDTKERVRREQLGANTFGDGDQAALDKELAEEFQELIAREKLGKGTRKALVKREKHMEYMSDSDDWDSSSEEESDVDKQGIKKEEDEKTKVEQKSGITSKGNNTPSSKLKASEATKKGKSLKRPGSPNLSESSGNESSRKKHKKQATGSAQGSRSTTPMPGSQRAKVNPGATSDGEATGGEVSDAGRAKKKLNNKLATHPRGTPSSSRPGSPGPASGPLSPGSASPNRLVSSTPGSPSGTVAAEIVATLAAQPQGMTVGKLLGQFSSRVGDNPGQMSRKDWIKLVKENAKWGADKLLRPKDS